jgi:hypothetical protein
MPGKESLLTSAFQPPQPPQHFSISRRRRQQKTRD